MSLAKFQKTFLNSIKNQSDSWLAENIKPAGTLEVESSLNIYRNDYRARLSEAIGEHYESVWFVLGDDDFLSLAHAYIDEHPSNVRDLGSYAKTFPDYISHSEYQKEFPFLFELAKYEQAFWSMFHAPEVKTFDPFANISVETLGESRWHLPDLCLLKSWSWDIPAIFSAREGNAENIELEIEKATACLMVKLERSVKTFSLTYSQFKILSSLEEGAALEEALQGDSKEIEQLFALLKGQGIPLRRRATGAS